jgi:lipopolysaccharide biosynthesis glycosyltransferase
MTSTALPPQAISKHHPATGTPSLVFAMCVEAGGFESMAIRAAQSLRAFGGRFSNCSVMAVTPRFGARLDRKTIAAFDSLNVEYLNVRPTNPYAWYPLMNKPLALQAVVEKTGAEQICFIDSDMIVMSEPNLLQLDDGTDFTACAPDKNIGSTGEDDSNTPFWKELCRVIGLSYEDLPWIHAHRENVDIRLYFNSGIFTFRKSSDFVGAYHRITADLLNARVASKVSDIYFHEQEAIGLATVKQKLRWRPLPHEYNYAVGRKIMDKYEPAKVRNGVILHYHDMMWPENWANLMERLKTDRPEIHDWLAARGPLRLQGSVLQKTFSKLLRSYRKKKFDRHKAACRVI